MNFKLYAANVFVAFDQLINTLFGGDPDETISSRAGKGRRAGRWFWTVAANFIDLLFCWQGHASHCEYYIEHDEGKYQVTKH